MFSSCVQLTFVFRTLVLACACFLVCDTFASVNRKSEYVHIVHAGARGSVCSVVSMFYISTPDNLVARNRYKSLSVAISGLDALTNPSCPLICTHPAVLFHFTPFNLSVRC